MDYYCHWNLWNLILFTILIFPLDSHIAFQRGQFEDLVLVLFLLYQRGGLHLQVDNAILFYWIYYGHKKFYDTGCRRLVISIGSLLSLKPVESNTIHDLNFPATLTHSLPNSYGECTTSRRTNCLKRFMGKYFIFMYLFYKPSIKIVSSENTNPS